MEKNVNAAKACIMITIFFSMSQGENHYTVSSINTFLKNLEKHHKITIKRRWIFYCFRWLLDNKYITRKSRYVQDGNGQITQIPSMISFTLSGAVFLVKRGVSGAKKIVKSMTKYFNKQDKRFPSRTNFDDGSWKPTDPDQRKALEGLLEIIPKEIS